MKPTATQATPEPAAKCAAPANLGSAMWTGIFLVICAAAVANQFERFGPVQPMIQATFIVTALVASIAAFAPTLAWPNAALAAGLAAAIGGMAHAISAVTGIPFGQVEYTAAAGPRLLGLIPWWLPMAWAVVALSSRGAARLILCKTREHPQHGYQVIALATGLAILSTLMLQNFALHGAHFWTAATPGSRFQLLGHALHLFIQIALTPLLIDKFPGPRPPNFRPLLVWTMINAVLVSALIAQ